MKINALRQKKILILSLDKSDCAKAKQKNGPDSPSRFKRIFTFRLRTNSTEDTQQYQEIAGIHQTISR